MTRWRRGLDFEGLVAAVCTLVGSFEYNVALQRIWLEVVDSANRYIQETEPFKLAKTDLEACRTVLVNLADWLRIAAILIKPFLPRTAETFYRAFNFEEMKAWESRRICRCAPATPPVGAARHRAAVGRQAGAAVPQDRGSTGALTQDLGPDRSRERG